MKASIKSIGSYWLTAWVNAGQPDLSALYVKEHEKKRMKSIDEIDDPELVQKKCKVDCTRINLAYFFFSFSFLKCFCEFCISNPLK